MSSPPHPHRLAPCRAGPEAKVAGSADEVRGAVPRPTPAHVEPLTNHRSGYLPKWLGVLMMVAGVGYVVDFLLLALVPDFDWQVAGLAFLAEAVFPFWLLIRGVDLEGWQRCIAAGRGSDQPDVLKGHP